MLELIALLLGCGHIRTLEQPMVFTAPIGVWSW